jgi:hypothetical protein
LVRIINSRTTTLKSGNGKLFKSQLYLAKIYRHLQTLKASFVNPFAGFRRGAMGDVLLHHSRLIDRCLTILIIVRKRWQARVGSGIAADRSHVAR